MMNSDDILCVFDLCDKVNWLGTPCLVRFSISHFMSWWVAMIWLFFTCWLWCCSVTLLPFGVFFSLVSPYTCTGSSLETRRKRRVQWYWGIVLWRTDYYEKYSYCWDYYHGNIDLHGEQFKTDEKFVCIWSLQHFVSHQVDSSVGIQSSFPSVLVHK